MGDNDSATSRPEKERRLHPAGGKPKDLPYDIGTLYAMTPVDHLFAEGSGMLVGKGSVSARFGFLRWGSGGVWVLLHQFAS